MERSSRLVFGEVSVGSAGYDAWGNFLVPFILLTNQDLFPASVVVYTFYTEGGQPQLGLIAAFSLLYSIPVVIAYLFVSRRYGFRFHGGIKS